MSDGAHVVIGYTHEHPEMSWVFARSVMERASIPVQTTFLYRPMLERALLYRRPRARNESTDFTFSRFLAPQMAEEWVLFADGDMLCLADIAELWDLRDPQYAVMVVQHPEYNPVRDVKMEGQIQTVNRRKNWSSLMLLNCQHPATRGLTPEYVSAASPAMLHQFEWAHDAIGSLPGRWNLLVGYTDVREMERPGIIHYTDGGPWLPEYQSVPFAEEWRREAERAGIQVRAGDMNERPGHPKDTDPPGPEPR